MDVGVRGGGGGDGESEAQSARPPSAVADRTSRAPSVQSESLERGRIFDRGSLLAFGLYAALSVFFLGRTLIFDFAGSYAGCGADPSLFIWSIVWWPYAITHRLNPFLTHVIFAPGGINAAWTTTIPLASLIVWPITAIGGPIVAYNSLVLLAPALTAWTTFILCRHLTKSFWPALVAGYLFGFSSYFLAQSLGGHLHLVLVFPLIIAIYLFVRWFDGMIESRTLACLAGLTLAAQFFLSVEIFATMTMFAALALLLALGSTTGALNRRIVKMTGVLACAYGITLVIASPYIYYMFAYGLPHGAIWDTRRFSADLLNFVIPTKVNALGALGPLLKIATAFPGNIFERTAYVGPILIAVAAVYAHRHWKEPLGKILVDSLVVICVLSFGPTLHFGGRELIAMPGKLLAVMPIIDKALPVRFTMYALLIIAIISALWLAQGEASIRAKIIVALLAVVFSLPNLDARYWSTKVDTPAFFATGLYKKYLIRDENVVVAPYCHLGNSMMWQAQTGMHFRMAGGYIGQLSDEYKRWPVISALTEWTYLPDPQMQLMSFLANHQVRAIVVSDSDPARSLWQRWLPAAVVTPLEIGGVTLYRIPPAALVPYRTITAADAERKADWALFNTMLSAASRYLSARRSPAALTPFVAQNLGLIPPDWPPGPLWVPAWIAGTKFDIRLDENEPLYRGVWLGYADETHLGVGFMGTYEGLKPIIDQYRAYAYRIYFPFPRRLAQGTYDGTRGLFMMFFDPAGLMHAIAANSRLAHGGPDVPGN